MRRVLLIVALVGSTLAGCTSTQVPTRTASPARSPAPAVSATPASPAGPSASADPSVSPSISQTRSGAGCPRTSATTPAGASTARIGDVDGDGRADLEWAYLRSRSGTLHFGVTTASGATIGTAQDFASGADRRVVVARLRNGAVVALPNDRHGIPLYTFAACSFRRPSGTDGRPYEIGQSDLQDDGIGAACHDGRLLALRNPRRGSTRALTATTVTVAPDGLTATDGATVVVYADAAAHPAAYQDAQSPTRGDAPVITLD